MDRTLVMARRRSGQARIHVSYGQYGTFRPGTSLAEREGSKTEMTGRPRLSAHPKSGASPAPAGDALEFAAATLALEKLRAETTLTVKRIRARERDCRQDLRAGDTADTRRLLDDLRRERIRVQGKLHRAEEKHREWEISRANKGFSPKRGYLAGGDIVADASRGGRTTRGRAEGEKIRQDKGERARM